MVERTTGIGVDVVKPPEVISSIDRVSVNLAETEDLKPVVDSVVSISSTGGADSARWLLSDIATKKNNNGTKDIKYDATDSDKNQQANRDELKKILHNRMDYQEYSLAELDNIINKLPQTLQKKLDALGLSGMVLNTSGITIGREASALASFAFMKSMVDSTSTDPNVLIAEGIKKAQSLISEFNIARDKKDTNGNPIDSTCSLTVGLINKKGEATVLNGHKHEVISIEKQATYNTLDTNNINLGARNKNPDILAANLNILPPRQINGKLIIGAIGTAQKLQRIPDISGLSLAGISQALSTIEKTSSQSIPGVSNATVEITSQSPEVTSLSPLSPRETTPTLLRNPEEDKAIHESPYFVDSRDGEPLENLEDKLFGEISHTNPDGSIKRIQIKYTDVVNDLYKKIEQHNLLSSNSGSTLEEKKIQVLQELAKRVRYSQDYLTKKDEIHDLIGNKYEDKDVLLMAIELQIVREMQKANETIEKAILAGDTSQELYVIPSVIYNKELIQLAPRAKLEELAALTTEAEPDIEVENTPEGESEPQIDTAPIDTSQPEPIAEVIMPPAQEKKKPLPRKHIFVGVGDKEQVRKIVSKSIDYLMQRRSAKQNIAQKIGTGIVHRMHRFREGRFVSGIVQDTKLTILTQDILDHVMTKGEQLREDAGFFSNIRYKIRNGISNATGLILTAEQKLAQEWISEQLKVEKPKVSILKRIGKVFSREQQPIIDENIIDHLMDRNNPDAEGLLSRIYEKRERAFVKDILIKTKRTNLTDTELDTVLNTANNTKNNARGINKMRYSIRDFVSRTGLIKTSEQVIAEKILINNSSSRLSRGDWNGSSLPDAQWRNNPNMDPQLKDLINKSMSAREHFADRYAVGNDEQFTLLHDEEYERREELQDQVAKKKIVNDFFVMVNDYINAPVPITDSEKKAFARLQLDIQRRIDAYCNEGYALPGGEKLSFRQRVGKKYEGFQSTYAVVGMNLRKVAEDFRTLASQYQEEGIVQDTTDVQAWMDAYDSTDPNKKIDITIYVAQGEMSGGSREASPLLQKPAELLRKLTPERMKKRKPIMGTKTTLQGYNAFGALLVNLGVNEVTASMVGGYAGAVGMTMIDRMSQNGLKFVGAGAIASIVPVAIAGSAVSLPMVAIAGGAAVTAGAVSTLRHIARISKELLSVERAASFGIGIATDNTAIDKKWVKGLKMLFGDTNRKEFMDNIVHQREASVLTRGLIEDSKLFSKGSDNNFDLSLEMPANTEATISLDTVRKTLASLAETRARTKAMVRNNRRFIRYENELAEAQQQQILDNASQEVYERLSYIIEKRPDLKSELYNTDYGITSFSDLYKKLEEGYYYNLVGDRKKFDRVRSLLTETIGAQEKPDANTLGILKQEESLRGRDNSFNKLKNRKGRMRFIGVAASSLVGGQAMVEARYWLTKIPLPIPEFNSGIIPSGMHLHQFKQQPPSVIHYGIKQMLGDGRDHEVELLPSTEIIEYKGIKFRPPDKFVFEADNGILRSPDGTPIDLGKLPVDANGNMDKAAFLEAVRMNDIISATKEIPFTAHQEISYKEQFNTTVIKLPKGATLDYVPNTNDHVIKGITLADGTHHAISDMDITEPENLPRFQSELEKVGIHSQPIEITKDYSEYISPQKTETITGEEFFSPNNDREKMFLHVRKTFRDYDTAISDGNELKMETFVDPQNPDTLIFHYKGMGNAFDKDLNPNSIDVQTIGKKDVGVFLTLPGKPNVGVFLRDESDGTTDFQIKMDPKSTQIVTMSDGSQMTMGELSKIFVDQEALKNAQGDLIRVGGPNGKNYLNIATELKDQQTVLRTANGVPSFAQIGQMKQDSEGKLFESWATIQRCGDTSSESIDVTRVSELKETIIIPKYTLNITSQDDIAIDLTKWMKEDSVNGGKFSVAAMPLPYTTYAAPGAVRAGAVPAYKPLRPMEQQKEISVRSRYMIAMEDILKVNQSRLPQSLKADYSNKLKPIYTQLENAIMRGTEAEIIEARHEFMLVLQQFNQKAISSRFGRAVTTDEKALAQEAEQRLTYEDAKKRLEQFIDKKTLQEVANTYFAGNIVQATAVRRNSPERDIFIKEQALKIFAMRTIVNNKMSPILETPLNWNDVSMPITDAEKARKDILDMINANLTTEHKANYIQAEVVVSQIQSITKDLYGEIKQKAEEQALETAISNGSITREKYSQYLTIRKDIISRIEKRLETQVLQIELEAKMEELQILIDQWNGVVLTPPSGGMPVAPPTPTRTGTARIPVAPARAPVAIPVAPPPARAVAQPVVTVVNPATVATSASTPEQIRDAVNASREAELARMQAAGMAIPQAPLKPAVSTERPVVAEAAETIENNNPVLFPNAEAVSNNEAEEIMNTFEIRADNVMYISNGKPLIGKLTKDILLQEGLQPKHKVVLPDGITAYLSDPYHSDDQNRVAVVGYIKEADRIVARTFYRSKSQSVWRYLPHHAYMAWYGKGFGEESINLPLPLQKIMDDLTVEGNTIRNVQNDQLIFLGTAHYHPDKLNRYSDQVEYLEQQLQSGRITTNIEQVSNIINKLKVLKEEEQKKKETISMLLRVAHEGKQLEGNFYTNDPDKKIAPQDLVFTNPLQAPDFNNIIASWKKETDLYGDITVDVVQSPDGNYRYAFYRFIDPVDGVLKAGIGYVDNGSAITGIGVRGEWINGGDLCTPVYEYAKQSAGYRGKRHPTDTNYVDMFQNYVSKIPVIQEYLNTIKNKRI